MYVLQVEHCMCMNMYECILYVFNMYALYRYACMNMIQTGVYTLQVLLQYEHYVFE